MECYVRGFVAVVPCGVRSTCTAVASVDFPCPDIPRTRATSMTLVLTLPMWPLLGKNVRKLKMGVSKNRGTPKWMVYNGKAY